MRHNNPDPRKKLTIDFLRPHPFLSMNVNVRKRDGNSPKVIQKYWIRPLDLELIIKGIMNISPKKMILMKNQPIDSKMVILLHYDSNLMELFVVISELKILEDQFVMYYFYKLVSSSAYLSFYFMI